MKETLNCESHLLIPKAPLCAVGSSKSLLSALISLTGLNSWEQNPLSSWTSVWARSVEQVFMNRHADNLTMFQKIKVELCVTGFPRRLTEKTAPLSRVTVLLTVLLFCFLSSKWKNNRWKNYRHWMEAHLCLIQHCFGCCLWVFGLILGRGNTI